MATPLSILRAILGAAFICTYTACTSGPVAVENSRIYYTKEYDIRLPVSSMFERRYQRVVRQQYDFSCGASALATLLTFHYGQPHTEQSVFLGMWNQGDQQQIKRVGFSLLEMKHYLASSGISSDGFKVTLDQIQQAQLPGIALVTIDRYKHFVVIKGLDRLNVLIGDPSLGLRRLSRTEFQRIWNGIYFALDVPNDPVIHNFRMTADESLAPEAMAPTPFSAAPVDLQVLALIRPRLDLGEL